MFDYAPMLIPLSLSASDARNHASVDNKYPSQHLLLRQPYTVQIIQLVEGPPPPPRNKISSAIEDTSDYYSSSYSSSAEDDDDDNESACSSYCSSDISPEQSEFSMDEPPDSLELSHETFSTTKRILAWRENFSAHMSATASEVSLPSTLKRKISLEPDTMSRSSKRSRSQASQGDASVLSLGMHSCPACDASFMTLQSLRQHGHDAKANEACSVAVEYAFE
ncbi:hypothetical protein C0995_016073 [Termitomyces sp. Mi166|nr:hypothetical protein C0995_016073 [Termitomyces sp. Mi166\